MRGFFLWLAIRAVLLWRSVVDAVRGWFGR